MARHEFPPIPPPTTAILWLWLPTLLAAHAFAIFWLLKAARDMNPRSCLRLGFWVQAFSDGRASRKRRSARARGRGEAGEASGGGGRSSGGDGGAVARCTSLDARVLAELGPISGARRGAGSAAQQGRCNARPGLQPALLQPWRRSRPRARPQPSCRCRACTSHAPRHLPTALAPRRARRRRRAAEQRQQRLHALEPVQRQALGRRGADGRP
jgi:hypothetical protein